ncbi:Ctr86p [Nakaseomyces bracarensis]|uniref:Ctr86p n=1 Tax=Nakaseomyces bracarensis TaxID=273131 RepID=UPI0038724339
MNEQLVLYNIKDALGQVEPDPTIYQDRLEAFNIIVLRTAQDSTYRTQLGDDSDIWLLMKEILSYCNFSNVKKFSQETVYWYKRTVRAIFVFARNLSVANALIPQELLIQNTAYKVFNSSLSIGNVNDDIEISLYSSILSFLHNINVNSVIFDKSTKDELFQFLSYPSLINYQYDENMMFPYILYFKDLLENDEFLYYFLRSEQKDEILYDFLMKKIMQDESQLFNIMKGVDLAYEDKELSSVDIILFKCFSKIAAHESFATYLEIIENTSFEKFLNILKTMQLVVTNIDNWNKFELTGIMTWTFRVFNQTADKIIHYFELKMEDDSEAHILHSKMITVLDILSKLSQYEHVQKFVLFYKGLEKLVTLLQTFQDNLIRVNFSKTAGGNVSAVKASNKLGEKLESENLIQSRIDSSKFKIKETNFPECKLLIIEIIANLVHGNKEVQDKIRDLQGLGLVLSNCVIDDNDPFIKERSIMCIKFLLENNPENQQYVAQLESKRAANDQVLQEAGYEVNIDSSGNLKLKSTSVEN